MYILHDFFTVIRGVLIFLEHSLQELVLGWFPQCFVSLGITWLEMDWVRGVREIVSVDMVVQVWNDSLAFVNRNLEEVVWYVAGVVARIACSREEISSSLMLRIYWIDFYFIASLNNGAMPPWCNNAIISAHACTHGFEYSRPFTTQNINVVKDRLRLWLNKI